MEPMRVSTSAKVAREKLLAVLRSMDRCTVVAAEPLYIHAEFRSPVFRFIDDVEFEINEATRTIDFRSAARTGWYDFNVNRRRMEEIRKRFADR